VSEDEAIAGSDANAATRRQWDDAAAGWDAHGAAIGRWLGAATEAMLGMAGVTTGNRVLEVAAGAGGQTLDIARRVGPKGRVLATDLSPAILARAAAHAKRAGLANVATLVADAEGLDVEPGAFDAAVSRLGLMLCADPGRGLAAIHRALRPGGGVCTMVFSRPDRNPCIATLMATALRHAGLAPPDPDRPGGLLSLGRPGRADRLFSTAGFRDVASTTIAAPFRWPSLGHYLDFVRASGGPVRSVIDRLDPSAAADAWADIEAQLAVFSTPAGWEGPHELLLTAARRGD
jgi:SAM-dependent methyltransferase